MTAAELIQLLEGSGWEAVNDVDHDAGATTYRSTLWSHPTDDITVEITRRTSQITNEQIIWALTEHAPEIRRHMDGAA